MPLLLGLVLGVPAQPGRLPTLKKLGMYLTESSHTCHGLGSGWQPCSSVCAPCGGGNPLGGVAAVSPAQVQPCRSCGPGAPAPVPALHWCPTTGIGAHTASLSPKRIPVLKGFACHETLQTCSPAPACLNGQVAAACGRMYSAPSWQIRCASCNPCCVSAVLYYSRPGEPCRPSQNAEQHALAKGPSCLPVGCKGDEKQGRQRTKGDAATRICLCLFPRTNHPPQSAAMSNFPHRR